LALTASSTFLASGSLFPIALGACATAGRHAIISMNTIENVLLSMIVVIWLGLANGQANAKKRLFH
jgi:predicted permease